MGSRSRSILDCIKPICLFGNRNHKKKKQQPGHRDEKKERLLKNNQLTLQDCIISSPSFNKSSPLPTVSSSKRIYPNPSFVNENVSIKTLLLRDHLNPLFQNDNDNDEETKKTKKRVSFRKPEVVDIFILTDESPASPDVQALQHL
ncbi:hypothetical protein L2E82_46124 [Cichorium intybus]|uniref:Uncharacterized protein n=1 Tax=Cichorium intybus TaxID=13427 RepID=A0ACB8YTQ8_CICIN|nr:hypothetical protein L2E82_46124 [Cichorium intybus]